MFPLFTTFVTCSAVDAAGNKAFFSFSIFVRDSIAPVARVVSPSPDAMIPTAPSTVSVDVEVIEAIGVSRVFINNVNAVMVGTTGQGTLWRASLSVPAGTALSIMPMAFDLFNNQSFPNPTVVDNDGIPADLDRSRQTGADTRGFYSNDFVDVTTNGVITSGTIARDGNSKVVAVKRNGGVGLTLVTPGRATITACAGTTKSFVLDTPNEGVDVTCSGTTINVRAYTPNAVEVSKQMSETRYETRTYCRWVRTGFFGGGYNSCYQEQVPFTYTYVYQFALRNGQGASTGSPVTAAADNTEPIHVDIVQVDDLGGEFHAGSFDLDPGESADVAVTPGVDRQDQIEFSVPAGDGDGHHRRGGADGRSRAARDGCAGSRRAGRDDQLADAQPDAQAAHSGERKVQRAGHGIHRRRRGGDKCDRRRVRRQRLLLYVLARSKRAGRLDGGHSGGLRGGRGLKRQPRVGRADPHGAQPAAVGVVLDRENLGARREGDGTAAERASEPGEGQHRGRV